MRKMAVLFVAASVLAMAFPVFAQELPKATKLKNAEYYTARYVKFKLGKVGEAYGIIRDHFVPVDKAIGRKVIAFHLQTGEWDEVVFFPLKEGPSELGWLTSPTGEKWWAAFAKQEGGTENARELWQKFLGLVARAKEEIAHIHVEPMKD